MAELLGLGNVNVSMYLHAMQIQKILTNSFYIFRQQE
jgi:hypothetical protein